MAKERQAGTSMYRGFSCGWDQADSGLRLNKYAKDKKQGSILIQKFMLINVRSFPG
jgi:hypothetical protein